MLRRFLVSIFVVNYYCRRCPAQSAFGIQTHNHNESEYFCSLFVSICTQIINRYMEVYQYYNNFAMRCMWITVVYLYILYIKCSFFFFLASTRGYLYLIGGVFSHLDSGFRDLTPTRGPLRSRLPGRGNAWSLLAGVDNRVRRSRAFEKRAARTASRVQHVSRGKHFNKNTNLAKNAPWSSAENGVVQVRGVMKSLIYRSILNSVYRSYTHTYIPILYADYIWIYIIYMLRYRPKVEGCT